MRWPDLGVSCAPTHHRALSPSPLSGPLLYGTRHLCLLIWPYLVVSLVVAVPFSPLALWGLQALGVRWAYRIGFPVGEFEKRDGLGPLDGPTEWVNVKDRAGTVLISERFGRANPMKSFWTNGWPDRLVATVEHGEGVAKLRVRADPMSSFIWLLPIAFAGTTAWAVVARMPGVQRASDLAFVAGIVALLFAGRWFFVRRARQRAALLADHLGFTSAASAV